MAREPVGRVAAAVVKSRHETANDFASALSMALSPGAEVTRYGRTWRMGQVDWREERAAVLGRIGFEAQGAPTELWDPVKRDFFPSRVRSGLTSPFAVSLNDRRVAFQLRPGKIQPTTFTSNFQALLNEANPAPQWAVEVEFVHESWEQWVGEVDRIVELRLQLRPPNPHYGQRRRMRELIEEANAAMLNIVVKADKADLEGLAIDAPFLEEALEHARQYGTYTAIGETGTGSSKQRVEWRLAAEEESVVRESPVDPVTREVSAESLLQRLEDPDAGSAQDHAGEENES